jgi:hypothetical protein
MLKALVIKELRESAGLAVLAVLAVAYLLGELTGHRLVPWDFARVWSTYPFVNDQLVYNMWFFMGGLAIALGLKQTAWELNQGTYLFLLHRPIRRSRVFELKLLIGGALVMTLSALLILLYAWWAATPGHFAAPFEWSMTENAWLNWIALPPMYVGAFLSGVRPGRWFGSRLVPLVAGLGAATVVAKIPWFWVAVAVSIVFTAIELVSVFYYVRERDY